MVFTYIWQKNVTKISKVPGVQRDVNPARQYLYLASYYAQNTLKKLANEIADWTNRWTSIEGVWAPWPNMHFHDWLFSWQNKNL